MHDSLAATPVAQDVAVYSLATLYLLLTVASVWVRVHCPAAHRPGDKRRYVATTWRSWCRRWRNDLSAPSNCPVSLTSRTQLSGRCASSSAEVRMTTSCLRISAAPQIKE